VSERRSASGRWSTAFLSSASEIESERGEVSPTRRATSPGTPDRPHVLTIRGDLDHILGSVSHAGSVSIRGDVAPDLTVFAGGGIEVGGDVRGARLVAGESIVVHGAVGGPGRSVLDAMGDITVRSARLADLTAGGDVRARHALVECSIRATGQVLLASSSGHLSGGEIRAVGGVQARTLGSHLGRRTSLEIGRAVPMEDPESVQRRLALCIQSTRRTSERIEEAFGRFDAMLEGRGGSIEMLRKLVRERERTLRLQASLVRRRRQANGGPGPEGAMVRASTVLAGVEVDRGRGPHPLEPTCRSHPGGTRGR
jgi:uncharacterized protein (DUF342 family)